MIAAYLINPLKSDYQTEDIAGEYLSLTIPDRTQVCGKGSFAAAYENAVEYPVFVFLPPLIPILSKRISASCLGELAAYEKTPEEFAQYACYQAYVCLMASRILDEKLSEQGIMGMFCKFGSVELSRPVAVMVWLNVE